MTTQVRSSWRATAVALLMVAALGACSDSTNPTPPPLARVASITLNTVDDTVMQGATLQLTAEVKDSSGNVLTVPVTWSSAAEDIATVDANGVVAGLAPGSALITATVGSFTATARIFVDFTIAAIEIALPENIELDVGDTVRISSVVKDPTGKQYRRGLNWSSSSQAIATVSSDGLLTAVYPGTTTITASAQGKSATLDVTVETTVYGVVIGGAVSEPLKVDSTRKLTAYALDSSNAPINRKISWMSSNEGIATVDQTGLVKGVSRGSATITATAGDKSGSAAVRIVGTSTGGETETETANNLSWPVNFADGVGIAGADITTGAGLRLPPDSSVIDTLPFWWSGNVADFSTYYVQGGTNVWQAMWTNGGLTDVVHAEAQWGDNLSSTPFNTHMNVHAEVALNDYLSPQLVGFVMQSLYGTGSTEVFGATGATALFTPTIYTVTPRMIVEKLNDQHHPVYTILDQALAETFVTEEEGGSGESGSTMKFAAEITGGGKLVYSYNLLVQNITLPTGMEKFGWYRFTFVLDDNAMVNGQTVARHVTIDSLYTSSDEGEDGGNTGTKPVPQLDAQRNMTWIDVYVSSASGGSH